MNWPDEFSIIISMRYSQQQLVFLLHESLITFNGLPESKVGSDLYF